MTTTMIMVIIIESEIETHGMMIATTTMVRHRGGELNIEHPGELNIELTMSFQSSRDRDRRHSRSRSRDGYNEMNDEDSSWSNR